MENKDEVLKKISSGDPATVAGAIREIQENGDISIAGSLLDLLEVSGDSRQTTLVVNLLADVKDKDFPALLMKRLQASATPALKKELLRIVWESSLDYSAYLSVFWDLLLNAPFETAFEASTVIENLVSHLTAEQREQLKADIKAANIPADRHFFTENILTEIDEVTASEEEAEEADA